MDEKDQDFKGYKRQVRVRVSFESEPSLTRQEFQQDCDINFIVKRFLSTGELPPFSAPSREVDGLECPGDFTEACNMLFDSSGSPVLSSQEQKPEDSPQDQKPEDSPQEQKPEDSPQE